MDQKQLGVFGENIACRYLEGKGYKILERNFCKNWDSAKKGEIDIVAKKDDIIVFVEVKTLKKEATKGKLNNGVGLSPEDKVNFQKRRKLVNLAESWLVKNKIPLDSKWQIDVVSVSADLVSRKAGIRHFKNIAC